MERRVTSRVLLALMAVAAIAVYLVSCSSNETDEPPVAEDEPVLDEPPDPAIEEFDKRRVEYEKALAAMPVPELAREMAKDSQAQTEPFNSPAAREIERRPENERPRIAKELASSLTAPDASSHIGLITLYRISPQTYYALKPDFRYRVLMDALSKATVMNAWGVPHQFLTEPAAEAIICEGPPIERYLYPVLDVARKTVVFGNTEVDFYTKEENVYLVRDYALALIHAVRGEREFQIPATRPERDALIEQIRKESTLRGAARTRGPQGRGPQLPDCPARGGATQTAS